MSTAKAVVTLAGAAVIAWELWYFSGSTRRRRPASFDPGVQEARVLVKDGYTPETLVVRAGTPLRLRFFRDERAERSARVVFDTLGIECELAPFEITTIELPATAPGTYPFHGDGDLRGVLIVEPAKAPLGPVASGSHA